MFGAICGGDLDAWMEACKLDNVIPNNSEPKIYFPVWIQIISYIIY